MARCFPDSQADARALSGCVISGFAHGVGQLYLWLRLGVCSASGSILPPHSSYIFDQPGNPPDDFPVESVDGVEARWEKRGSRNIYGAQWMDGMDSARYLTYLLLRSPNGGFVLFPKIGFASSSWRGLSFADDVHSNAVPCLVSKGRPILKRPGTRQAQDAICF